MVNENIAICYEQLDNTGTYPIGYLYFNETDEYYHSKYINSDINAMRCLGIQVKEDSAIQIFYYLNYYNVMSWKT